jgi:hypothetical protein
VPVTRVLHGAGNTRAMLALAGHPAVDAIEADVWSHGGHILAHHDRRIGPLPLMLGHRGPRRFEGLSIEEIVEGVAGRTSLVLDLRAVPFSGDPSVDLVRALAGVDCSRIRITCEDWTLADRVRAWAPDLAVAYSIRSEAQFRAYIAGRDAGSIERTPVVVRHTLIHTPDEVEVLRERAGRVGVWTVDDTDRALALVAWGVDEITSNRVTVLNAV